MGLKGLRSRTFNLHKSMTAEFNRVAAHNKHNPHQKELVKQLKETKMKHTAKQ